MLLKDRVVIVAGVGPGLGRDLTHACVRHGADVVLVARTGERLRTVESELRGRVGTLCLAADLSRPDDALRVARDTLDRFGRIDGLVNNAAMIPPFSDMADVTHDEVRDSLETNFYSAFNLTRAVIPAMISQAGGSIVMVGSAVVRHPKPRFGAYNIAKHASLGFARSLALELGPAGIRVNTLAPGKIAGERLYDYFQMRGRELGTDAATVEAEYAAKLALRRIPNSAEYADVAIFLLSDLSRTITGHLLDANGGEYFD